VAYRIEAFDPGRHDTKDFGCGSDSQDNVFLSHLAVDRRQQGQGLGRILLVDAMQQCLRAKQILGVRLMVLDVAGGANEAERARLHRFYASMGFRPLPGRPERLFISLSDLPPLQSGGLGSRGADVSCSRP
jgi:GNAT superfamily N-acetyltransferase